jgi:pilus assembly protein CpaB
MKPARIMLLAFALTAGALAYGLATYGQPDAPLLQPSVPPTADVLVAAGDWSVSQVLQDKDFAWESWPASLIAPGMIRRVAGSDPVTELRGAFVRQAVATGEPVRREKLLRAGRTSSYLAATITPGLRAIAIPIDAQGLATAGGFIFPNDRVDVLGATRGETAEPQTVRTLVSNVRVLAIGANVAERVGERVLAGATATLEVTPEQSELILLAQRNSTFTLALRALADAGPGGPQAGAESVASIVRFGAQGAR